MINKLKSLITEHQKKSGNTSGYEIPKMQIDMEMTYSEIAVLLNQLAKEQFIKVRQGINGKIVFLK